MIRLDEVTLRYADITALDRVSLRVAAGDVVALVGHNGAGKSSAMRLLVGLEEPAEGRVLIAGRDLQVDSLNAKASLGYVPEDDQLHDWLTVGAFLDLVGALHLLAADVSATRRARLLDLFGIGRKEHRRLGDCSKGERRIVLIVAALLHAPDVLILDEPFDGLDANAALVLQKVIAQFAVDGKAVLFSSHVPEIVERISSSICVLRRGQVEATGTSAELREQCRAETLAEAFAHLIQPRLPRQLDADVSSAVGRQ